MISEKEWGNFYTKVMPMGSVLLGISSICLAVWVIVSRKETTASLGGLKPDKGYSSLGIYPPKVHYTNGDILVAVRNPGEWYDPRDFIEPMDPRVQSIYQKVGPDPWALLDWVCSNITYHSDNGEWWEFPAETLSHKYADCDGSSILLESLLRNFTDAYVVVGSYRGLGHAWVELDGQILETTYTQARPVADPQNYRPYAYFNDQEIIELWPRAMTALYQLERNECKKLMAMAGAVRAAT